MNDFPLTTCEQEKRQRIMNNHIESGPFGPVVSMTGQLAMNVFDIDRVGRNISKTTSPAFKLKTDPRTGECICKATKIGASVQNLLMWPLQQIKSCLMVHQLSPESKLLLEALIDLQQNMAYLTHYGDQEARINVVVNELRINFKKPAFIRQCYMWNNAIKENLNEVNSFIKKRLQNFNLLQVCSFEINQAGLNVAGNYPLLMELHHEMETERKKALKRFYTAIEEDIFPQQLAGILCTTGYSPYKGLYHKIDLIFWGSENHLPMVMNMHDITACWHKATLPNQTTLHGTCLASQIYADVNFGLLADGDQLGLSMLKAHFLTRIETNYCFQLSSRVFKSHIEIYQPELLKDDLAA